MANIQGDQMNGLNVGEQDVNGENAAREENPNNNNNNNAVIEIDCGEQDDEFPPNSYLAEFYRNMIENNANATPSYQNFNTNFARLYYDTEKKNFRFRIKNRQYIEHNSLAEVHIMYSDEEIGKGMMDIYITINYKMSNTSLRYLDGQFTEVVEELRYPPEYFNPISFPHYPFVFHQRNTDDNPTLTNFYQCNCEHFRLSLIANTTEENRMPDFIVHVFDNDAIRTYVSVLVEPLMGNNGSIVHPAVATVADDSDGSEYVSSDESDLEYEDEDVLSGESELGNKREENKVVEVPSVDGELKYEKEEESELADVLRNDSELESEKEKESELVTVLSDKGDQEYEIEDVLSSETDLEYDEIIER